jgi:hypothetical protein
MLNRLPVAIVLAMLLLLVTGSGASAHVAADHAHAPAQYIAQTLAALGVAGCVGFAWWRWRRRAL